MKNIDTDLLMFSITIILVTGMIVGAIVYDAKLKLDAGLIPAGYVEVSKCTE